MDRHADTSARDDKRGILCVIASGDCACASIFMLSLRDTALAVARQSIKNKTKILESFASFFTILT